MTHHIPPAQAARFGWSRTARSVVAFVALALLGTAGGLLLDRPASAAPGTDRLTAGKQLNPGERLVSPNGQYVLIMQGDGNLVEYAAGNRAVWASGTNRANSIVRMQSDGNLVVVAPGNVPVWATGSNGNPNADIELQSDGNVVVYAQGHAARWASAGASGSSALGDRIAATARAETTGPDRNHESSYNCNYYSGAVGTGTPCGNGRRTEEWCADFARWVWGQAGARTGGLSAAAGSFYSYGLANHTWRAGGSASNARVGDAVVYNLNQASRYASHVGLVVAVSGNTITVVSGNSGNPSNRVTTVTFVPGSTVSGYASPVA